MEEPVRKIGPYKLLRKIGRGAFGVVWLAERQSAVVATQVAVKLPRDEDIDLEAFKQEAIIWVQASGHPNVVSLIEADIYDEQVVIVSEYIPDGSLAGWLKQHGGKAPSIESACEIIKGVLAGLDHLHERHIIHRDLKPDNILMRRETPRLADFGIARLLRTDSYSEKVTGTHAYMAPEAFKGKRNEKTDIWAVGVIFYQLLVGCLPYEQQDTAALIAAIMFNEPSPVPFSVPQVVRRVVIKAMQRDATQRYSSAIEMLNDVREAERQLMVSWPQPNDVVPTVPLPSPNVPTIPGPPPVVPPIVPAPTPPVVVQKSSHLRAWVIGVVIVLSLGCALVIAAIYAVRQKDREFRGASPAESSSENSAPIDDATIQSQIERAIASDPSLSKSDVSTLVEKGKVTIVGSVSSSDLKQRIERAIRSVTGVSAVDNQIVITEAAARIKPMTNKIGMNFVWIPSGTFMMGSQGDDEKPIHRVTLSDGFYTGRYEVTQGQWQNVMNTTVRQQRDKADPSSQAWQVGEGASYPMYYVSWNDAQEFIGKLNQMNDGWKYRLPTEAEWEYTCRAGTSGNYAGDLDTIAWNKDNSGLVTHPVGEKQSNAFGVYDMQGNVSEWCQDWYHSTYANAPNDGSAWLMGGEQRVYRGGSFFTIFNDSYESAHRFKAAPGDRHESVGFRVVAVR